jgi:8-oxo-dGTP pyrophosphatase MutT (NUDIX family)
MPDVKGGRVSPITAAMQRVVSGVRTTIQGVSPSNWFGPLQPLQPMAPPEVKGRQWDFPVGLNVNYIPRSPEQGYASFADLRALADNLPLLRLVIETRKDQIESIGWSIKPKGVQGNKFSEAGKLKDPDIEAVTAFFASPDRRNPFATWMRMMLEEVFVTDALALEPRMTRGGDFYGLDLITGDTIKPLIDESGRPPTPPNPAYQQILHGVVAADFSSDELLYMPRNRRVNRLYGFSPVEQIILTVNIALRRDVHTLNYYKEGTIPDAFGTLPKEWSQQQIGDFQKYFDALLTDNSADRRKLRFLPEGFVFQPVVQPPLKDLYDEWLARIVCYAFSVPVTPFVSQVNRATADTLQVEAAAEGLTPLKNWIKSVFDVVIQRYMKKPGLEFAWADEEVSDVLARAQADASDIGCRVKTVNEVRDERGLPPLPDEQADGAPPPNPVDVLQAKSQLEGGKPPQGDNKPPAQKGKVAKSAPFAAGICFLTPDRKALFLRRTGDDHGGEWCLPGGKVEPGEAPSEAATREAAEEAGVYASLSDQPMPISLTTIADDGRQFATFLRYVSGEREVHLDLSESSDYAWASVDNPPQPLHPGVSRTLPILAAYQHPAEKFAKYSPNQSRDDHGRFASNGAASLVQTRRRKPREVQGAKWEATTQSGIRLEAVKRAAIGAARVAGAAYAAGFVPALRTAATRGAISAVLATTGSAATAAWIGGPAGAVVGVAASLVLSGVAGEGIHDIFSSGHALLEQACDALGIHRAYADRAVTLTRAVFYGSLNELAPGLKDLARDIGKAAGGADKYLLHVLEIWREHGDALATAWVEAFKKEIEASDISHDEKQIALKYADGTRELFLHALMNAEHDAEQGKSAVDKIAAGLEEAIAIARGEAEPAALTKYSPDQPRDALGRFGRGGSVTETEKRNAAESYATTDYDYVNRNLRGMPEPTSLLASIGLRQGVDVEKVVRGLDALTSKPLADNPGVVFRGVGKQFFDELEGALAPGSVITDPAFLSTTTDAAAARTYADANGHDDLWSNVTGASGGKSAVMEITLPAGTKGALLNDWDGTGAEAIPEYLLPRGTGLEIESYDREKGIIRATARTK